MGVGLLIRQHISHQNYEINRESENQVTRSNVGYLFKTNLNWNVLVAFVFFILITPSGIYFFFDTSNSSGFHWLFPWILLCFSCALSLVASGVLMCLEAMGIMERVQKIRLTATVVSSIIGITVLCEGHGLYLSAVYPSVLSILSLSWIWFEYRASIASLMKTNANNVTINFKKDILPVQIKLSLNWIFGFFLYSSLPPFVFKVYGSEFAGLVGFTNAVFMMLLNFSQTMMYINQPRVGGLASQGKFSSVIKLTVKTSKVSNVFFCALFFMSIFFLYGINDILGIINNEALLPIEYYCLFGVFYLLRHLVGNHASIVRSLKSEIHLKTTIIGVVFIALSYAFAIYGNGFFDFLIVYLTLPSFVIYVHSKMVTNKFLDDIK